MRKEAVYTLLLNCTLFQGMRCFVAQDPRYLRFSTIEDGSTTHYNLRVSPLVNDVECQALKHFFHQVASAKVAQELLDEINANIPTTL
jgi:Ran-binding protein 3